MRKAFTISAIAVAATLAMAGPATAFASEGPASPAVSVSDTPSPATSPSDSHPSDKAEAPVVSVISAPKDKTGYAAGEVVKFKVSAPAGAKVSASSDALNGITVTQTGKGGDHNTYLGSGTVKSGFGIGTAHLTVTADFGDTGSQGATSFLVNTDTRPSPTPPVPAPSQASMSLSTDGGKPGDKVAVTIKSGNLKGNATVRSAAFTSTVKLERDPQHEGTWHGQATVSGNTKTGYYAVSGYVGNTKIDTAKFGVAAGDAANNGKHHSANDGDHHAVNNGGHHTANNGDRHSVNNGDRHSVNNGDHHAVNNGDHHTLQRAHVKPLHPQEFKVPKGSVQTGMAPASGSGVDTGLIAGGAAIGAAALAGTVVLRRRRSNG
ncbi:hypothetical protein ACIQM4_04710 [Streptomyces sp. NPDC091272]|uniref:hypothetical protein n=1 Tax=Streptomyces sp. NPDC091272 TaxID=3365981 RepID=UPI00382188F0